MRPAQRAHVGLHLREVAPAGGLVDDVVVDRLDEQPQRGDRRAQVVGDRRDEVAAGRVRGLAGVLGAGQPRAERVDRAGELRQLVAGAGSQRSGALALADRLQGVAHRLHVAHHPAGEQPGGAHGDEPREHRDDPDEQRVVGRDEHQRREGDGDEHHLPGGDGHSEAELAPQRAEALAPRRGQVSDREHHQPEAGEQQEGQDRGMAAVDGEHDERAAGRARRGGESREERPACVVARGAGPSRASHGWNR